MAEAPKPDTTPPVDLSKLEEDDEFEEFDAEGAPSQTFAVRVRVP